MCEGQERVNTTARELERASQRVVCGGTREVYVSWEMCLAPMLHTANLAGRGATYRTPTYKGSISNFR